MKLTRNTTYGIIAAVLTFASTTAIAAALPCDCHSDTSGSLQCSCDPGTGGDPGLPCTADPVACDFKATVVPAPQPDGAPCPSDSCNYANGCTDVR
jgi:hypothetical protein